MLPWAIVWLNVFLLEIVYYRQQSKRLTTIETYKSRIFSKCKFFFKKRLRINFFSKCFLTKFVVFYTQCIGEIKIYLTHLLLKFLYINNEKYYFQNYSKIPLKTSRKSFFLLYTVLNEKVFCEVTISLCDLVSKLEILNFA